MCLNTKTPSQTQDRLIDTDNKGKTSCPTKQAAKQALPTDWLQQTTKNIAALALATTPAAMPAVTLATTTAVMLGALVSGLPCDPPRALPLCLGLVL